MKAEVNGAVVWINACTAKVNASRRLWPRRRVCLEGRHTLEQIAQNGRGHGVEKVYSSHYYLSAPDGTVSGNSVSDSLRKYLSIRPLASLNNVRTFLD